MDVVEELLKLAERAARERPTRLPSGTWPEELKPVIEWLRSLSPMKVKVAYLGPPGSYTHEAASLVFPKEELVSKGSIPEVFESVEKGEADFGVVPIANRLEGPVNETIDAFLQSHVKVYYDVEIPIRIMLASGTVKDVKEIKRVYGHPMIFKQATKLLKELGVEQVPTSSTSEAARIAAQEPGAAALCSPKAVEMYKLKVLRANVEDKPHNATRFFVIHKRDNPEGDKTALLASVPHRPGGLFEFLKPFAERGINLTMIYSRPLKDHPWRYVFYIETEGSREALKEVLEEASKISSFLKILGSYTKLDLTG
ncbi:Prephenate dehydratase [Ignicoccus hospitalis KIN4/I]|uniref:prephenate dehydratase n=1 Tax=Ignicoccus hospitalis (strain KIN4/I / DSM 18386 / JCM 14125) TaxID=453591 RepID=A8A988_IGNH4|nr:Prephenate dehydratase [Ignicoccus hospitalis KIN4/I]HIH90424.1 prephenate dehydratase [Desulfurococcaceae archaeon]